MGHTHPGRAGQKEERKQTDPLYALRHSAAHSTPPPGGVCRRQTVWRELSEHWTGHAGLRPSTRWWGHGAMAEVI